LHNSVGSLDGADLIDRLGRKEPEFGSYAGQLGTGDGVQQSMVHLMNIPLLRERRFEELIIVEVLMGEMFRSD
jgi:hypothetical protein